MASIYAMMHVYDLQKTLGDDRLRSATEAADQMLKEKENCAQLLDQLSRHKSGGINKGELAYFRGFLERCGIDKTMLDDGKFFFHENKDVAWMNNAGHKETKDNMDRFEEVMKAVQRRLDYFSDKLNGLNSKMEIAKAEAQDGESRYGKAVSDIEAMLKELRQN